MQALRNEWDLDDVDMQIVLFLYENFMEVLKFSQAHVTWVLATSTESDSNEYKLGGVNKDGEVKYLLYSR